MLVTFSVGYVLLLRQSIAVQAAVLAVFLRRRGAFERERCADECGLAALQPDMVVDYVGLSQQAAAWLGASGGGGGAPSCQGACLAVHAWLQMMVGVVLPLAILLLTESTARRRYLRQRMPKPRPGAGGPGGGCGGCGKGPSRFAMWAAALAWFLGTGAGSWAVLDWMRMAGLWGT